MATAKKKATFAQLKKKKPIRKEVRVYLDDQGIERLSELKAQINRMELMASSWRGEDAKRNDEKLEKLHTEAEELEAQLAEHSVLVVFESMGRHAYEELVKDHPATDADHELWKELTEGKGKAPYHYDTFAPALIAASAVEPQMTPEEVKELQKEWNDTEFTELFQAALQVNNVRRSALLGK